MIKLLVIEDEKAIRDLIRFALPTSGYNMIEAENVVLANKILTEIIPDIIILDWMLPGKSGIEFIKWLRKHDLLHHIPVIMLTARAEEENRIKGLEAGADDYLTKPFSPQELIARIKTILRRGPLLKKTYHLQTKDLLINIEQQLVQIKGEAIQLRPIEYRLLHFFMTHPDKIFSRQQLINYIWGTTTYIDERTVDVNIRRLRNKLKPFAYDCMIKTARSTGYQFTSE